MSASLLFLPFFLFLLHRMQKFTHFFQLSVSQSALVVTEQIAITVHPSRLLLIVEKAERLFRFVLLWMHFKMALKCGGEM